MRLDAFECVGYGWEAFGHFWNFGFLELNEFDLNGLDCSISKDFGGGYKRGVRNGRFGFDRFGFRKARFRLVLGTEHTSYFTY